MRVTVPASWNALLHFRIHRGTSNVVVGAFRFAPRPIHRLEARHLGRRGNIGLLGGCAPIGRKRRPDLGRLGGQAFFRDFRAIDRLWRVSLPTKGHKGSTPSIEEVGSRARSKKAAHLVGRGLSNDPIPLEMVQEVVVPLLV